MTENDVEDKGDAPPRHDDQDRPSGAIMVTAFLAVVIVVSWFALFAIYMART